MKDSFGNIPNKIILFRSLCLVNDKMPERGAFFRTLAFCGKLWYDMPTETNGRQLWKRLQSFGRCGRRSAS